MPWQTTLTPVVTPPFIIASVTGVAATVSVSAVSAAVDAVISFNTPTVFSRRTATPTS